MALSGADHKAVMTLLEHAQLVYLLTRYPKKQVLDDAGDVTRLEQGLDAMRAAARKTSSALRERTPDVPWEQLLKGGDGADVAWRTAKRVTPRVLAYLVPLVEGAPEAAFFLRPEAAKPRAKAATHANAARPRATRKSATPRTAPRPRGRTARRPGREDRRT